MSDKNGKSSGHTSGGDSTVDRRTGITHHTDWYDDGHGESGRVSWDEGPSGSEVPDSFHTSRQKTRSTKKR